MKSEMNDSLLNPPVNVRLRASLVSTFILRP